MKQNLITESFFEEFQSHSPRFDSNPNQGSKALSGTSYARDLRVLGQMIEEYSFTSLHVEVADGHYQVCGLQKEPNPHWTPFMRPLRRRSAVQDRGTRDLATLCQVTAQDITAANTLNQQYRQNSGDAPDPFRVFQILRAVGFYLDTRRDAKLKCFSIANNYVSLEYKTTSGKTEILEKSFEFFYAYWVNMFLLAGVTRLLPNLATSPAQG